MPNANPDFQQRLSFWHHDRIREFVKAKDLEFSTEEQRWVAHNRLRRSSRTRCRRAAILTTEEERDVWMRAPLGRSEGAAARAAGRRALKIVLRGSDKEDRAAT